MNDPQQPASGSNLAALGALLGFLAAHPELDTLPITWSIRQGKDEPLTGTLADGHPGAGAVCQQIAHLTGGTRGTGEPYKVAKAQIRTLHYAIDGHIGGQELFFSGADLADAPAGDES